MLTTRARLTATMGLALLMNPVQAQQKWPHMPTPNEIALMPDYCQAKMGSDAAVYQQWNQRMGPDKFMHLHHYCHGLKQMNRAKLTFETQQRRYMLQTAIGEFDYVLRAWPDGFALKIEAKTRRTDAETKLRLL
jgi:hypothetical protein